MAVEWDGLLTSFVLTAVCLRLLPKALPVGKRLGVGAVVLIVSLLPYPWGLALWVLSYLSGFSISAGVLALLFLYHCVVGTQALPVRQVRQMSVLLLGVAVVFYPLSMGVGAWDPYALGYGSRLLSVLLLGVGVLALVARNWLLCVLLIVGQMAWTAHLLRSDNLWDYLFDPWLVMWAVAWLIVDLRVRCRAQQQSRPDALQSLADSPQEG